jgi:hypothetical protein
VRAFAIAVLAGGLAACSFHPPGSSDASGVGPIDGAGDDDVDGMPGVIDAPVADASPPDATVPCPTDVPAGCTGVAFECAGSSSCYALCSAPGVTHANAEGRCQTWGGHLASLATTEEQACAVAQFTTANTGDMWIGLHQGSGAGSPTVGWTYLDGTAYAGFTAWHSGQPDDYQGTEDGEEQCADTEVGWTWEWNDEVCSDEQGFLCERPR